MGRSILLPKSVGDIPCKPCLNSSQHNLLAELAGNGAQLLNAGNERNANGAASSSTTTTRTSRHDRPNSPDLASSASFHGGQGRLLGAARPNGVAPVRLNQTLGRARSMIQQASRFRPGKKHDSASFKLWLVKENVPYRKIAFHRPDELEIGFIRMHSCDRFLYIGNDRN
eukprot:Seg2030.1 transcript_id=Seg2030.1/GoldUCD/mRNA.D3Y31 product="hypothetical protein" protein_id=Seg2030.1/GoldUCD/D3Y31